MIGRSAAGAPSRSGGYAERAHRAMRHELLDAAAGGIVGNGYRKLRMQDIAARVGVSRQTVYNEFGDKWGVVRALVLRETDRFLDGIDEALTRSSGPYDAICAAVAYTLRQAADDPLVKAIITGTGGDELLPLLTTRGEPVLVTARSRLALRLLEQWPHLHPRDVDLVADTTTRLAVSHIMLPLHPPEAVAGSIARLVTRYLGEEAAADPALVDPDPAAPDPAPDPAAPDREACP
ncbi:MAG: TetR family transcriptional regulator [Streptomycetales bacterium]